MDEQALPEFYEITSLEQLRVMADERRIRILETLAARAMTATQLAELLGEAPAKVHYHVRELERVGLLRLVETREKGGILEKYYRAVARNFRSTDMLLRANDSDEVLSPVRAFLMSTVENFIQASTALIREYKEGVPQAVNGASGGQLWLTQEEGRQFVRELSDLMDRYSTPRGIEGEQERSFVWLAYDPRLVPSAPEGIEMDIPTPTTPPVATPHIVRIVVLGGLGYSRAELERVVQRGEQLSINVVGACSFADDVTPELAERAIARFRHRGLLHAPHGVQEVLTRKS